MQAEDWYSFIYSAKSNNKARGRNQSLDLQTSNKMYLYIIIIWIFTVRSYVITYNAIFDIKVKFKLEKTKRR